MAGSGQAGGGGQWQKMRLRGRPGRTLWLTAQDRVQGKARLPTWDPQDRGVPSLERVRHAGRPAQCWCPSQATQVCARPQPASGTRPVTRHPSGPTGCAMLRSFLRDSGLCPATPPSDAIFMSTDKSLSDKTKKLGLVPPAHAAPGASACHAVAVRPRLSYPHPPGAQLIPLWLLQQTGSPPLSPAPERPGGANAGTYRARQELPGRGAPGRGLTWLYG